MSPREQALSQELFGGQQQSMGAIQALATGLKEAVQGFADGMGQVYDLAQSSPSLNHMASMGTHEIAAALFGPNHSGFVMYPRGNRDDHGVHGPEQSPDQARDMQQDAPELHRERGGRSM
jgi:hypothetical protein